MSGGISYNISESIIKRLLKQFMLGFFSLNSKKFLKFSLVEKSVLREIYEGVLRKISEGILKGDSEEFYGRFFLKIPRRVYEGISEGS